MNTRPGNSFSALRSAGRLLPLWLLLSVGAASIAHAAAPTVTLLKVDSVLLGEAAPIHVEVADTDANLQRIDFYVSGPGISGEFLWATSTVSGASAVVDRTWTPSQLGYFTIRAAAVDTTSATSSLSRTLESFAERRTVQDAIFQSGTTNVFSAQGELLTKENTSATNLDAQSGSTVILWAKSRVRLKPGFRARAGSTFWAAVDADMDGYSDVEEATDSDGDGMPDAWEFDHNLQVFVNDAAGDLDGDGMSNLAEYQAGRDPNNRNDGPGLPGGVQLVLRLGSQTSPIYRGVNTTTWAISTVANP